MLATVRKPPGAGTVERFDSGPEGRFHLPTVEFLDADGPEEQSLIWEREPDASSRLSPAKTVETLVQEFPGFEDLSP